MRRDRLLRPSKRRQHASVRPSAAESLFPLSDFLVPPSDVKGRSSSFSISVPPQVKRIASIIVQSGKFPFKTDNDVGRWALHKGIGELVKLADDPDVTGQYKQMTSWIRTMSKELDQLEYGRHLEMLQQGIEKMANNGHPDRAIHIAETVWKNCDSIEEPYWRDLFRKMSKRNLDRVTKMVERRRLSERRQGERRAEREQEEDEADD